MRVCPRHCDQRPAMVCSGHSVGAMQHMQVVPFGFPVVGGLCTFGDPCLGVMSLCSVWICWPHSGALCHRGSFAAVLGSDRRSCLGPRTRHGL